MILLVEEDPLQAQVRLSILKKRFTDVKRVASAAEALCLIEQSLTPRNLRLVISGDHLPDLEAPIFVAELQSRMPALPILVLGSSQAVAGEFAGSHVRFLARPVAADEILRVASQMIAWSVIKAA